jgi:glycosyltransferase involved in cell wall biosynthesis
LYRVLFVINNVTKYGGGVQIHHENLLMKIASKFFISVYFFTGKPKIINNINYLSYEKIKPRDININKYDIVHFHDYGSFLKFGLLRIVVGKIFSKTKFYITYHGWEGIYPPMFKIKLQRFFISKICENSILIGDYISKWYYEKSKFITYGFYRDSKKLSNQILDNYFLYIGRLDKDTGIETYINIFKILNNSNNNKFELYILGDGKLKESLIKKNINNIKFLGWRKNTDKFIRDAKIVFTDGYLSILQSLYFEKYVFSYYSNELKKDYLLPLKKYGLFVSDNEALMTRRITQLLKMNMFVNIKSKKIINKFSLDNLAKLYIKLWKK